jgi:hypothetical protein
MTSLQPSKENIQLCLQEIFFLFFTFCGHVALSGSRFGFADSTESGSVPYRNLKITKIRIEIN